MRLLIILAIGLIIPNDSLAADRIIGGSETTIEQYPFAAALLLSPSPSTIVYRQQCVGTIVNVRSVVTAAQCFMHYPSPTQWRVRVGSSSSRTGGVLHMTMAIISHEKFHPQTLHNDVAVLRIIEGFSFNNAVAIGKLPSPQTNLDAVENTLVDLVGWGTSLVDGPFSENIRHVQVPIINQNTCRSTYGNMGYTVSVNMICTSSEKVKGACFGDTGGPVINDNTIVGIISYTYSCGNPLHHGVHTRVRNYVNWIQVNQ